MQRIVDQDFDSDIQEPCTGNLKRILEKEREDQQSFTDMLKNYTIQPQEQVQAVQSAMYGISEDAVASASNGWVYTALGISMSPTLNLAQTGTDQYDAFLSRCL